MKASTNVLESLVASEETPGTSKFPPFAVDDELNSQAAEAISHYPDDQKRSAVLPLLHLVQHRFGYISAPAIDWVAGQLSVEPIKVVEVVTFYPGLRQSAPGKFHIRVCRTLSCAMAGSYELMDKLCEVTKIDRSQADPHSAPITVSPCGNYSVEFAECLASCGTGPVCMVNDDFHESIPAEKVSELLAQYPAT